MILEIVVSIICVYIAFFYWRRNSVRRKLWWLKRIHGYPILGSALDCVDSSKSLQAMEKMIKTTNGWCYFEVLSDHYILVTRYKLVECVLSSNTILKKGSAYDGLNRWLQDGILIATGSKWRKTRKILTPAFHFNILERFVEVFEEPSNTFIKILNSKVGEGQVNIHPYVIRYTLDVIYQTAMGVQLKVQEAAHNDYCEAVSEMCRIVVERAFKPLKINDYLYMLTSDYWNELKYVKLLREVADRVIEIKKKELESKEGAEEKEEYDEFGNKPKLAFLDLLLKYTDEGKPLSSSYIRNEVQTIMFAGHDTTAAALQFALYRLAIHPEVQKKALDEVMELTNASDGKITLRVLQEMKYMDMVIKETLRLYPSVPFYSREVTEDVTFEEGKIIPKGTTLLIAAWVIHRDPEVFENPEEFIPTRFLDKEIKPFSYVPFSAGPRNCIGQKFAILELKYTLSKVLLNFELLPGDPDSAPVLAAESVLKSVNGVNIRLKKRLPHSTQ